MPPPARRPRNPNSRGDTILSVMISVVIVGAVIGVTYQLVNSSVQLGIAGRERSLAGNIAQTQIERIKALVANNPHHIFDDTSGFVIDRYSTPPNDPIPGFGPVFCLHHDPVPTAQPQIDIKTGTDCRGPLNTGFLVGIAEPEIEVRYKHCSSDGATPPACLPPGTDTDRNRFEIKVIWTSVGTSNRENYPAYFRSHPIN